MNFSRNCPGGPTLPSSTTLMRVVHGPQDEPETVRKALEDSVKKYYAFYQLPCDEFSQTELDEYAVNAWPCSPKPRVRQGEEVLPPELLSGIGLESGVISYGGFYTLLVRLDFDVKGTAERFTVIGADGHSYEFLLAGIIAMVIVV